MHVNYQEWQLFFTLIEACFDEVCEAIQFVEIDLRYGYHQICMKMDNPTHETTCQWSENPWKEMP